MTNREVRLIQNAGAVLPRLSDAELYHLAHALTAALDARRSPAVVESLALECALLPAAQRARQVDLDLAFSVLDFA